MLHSNAVFDRDTIESMRCREVYSETILGVVCGRIWAALGEALEGPDLEDRD